MARWTDLATWMGPTVNQGPAMVEVRGVVLHIAEGSYAGTIAWQRNPTADVSSHFVCGKVRGETAQMVDTGMSAWTQRSGNGHWLSIENAGFVPDALTEAQVEFAAQILARSHRLHGVPLQVTNSPDGRGLGHHSMGAPAWGHSQCPGTRIIAQKPAIVARAKQIIEGDDMALDKDDVATILKTDGIIASQPKAGDPGTDEGFIRWETAIERDRVKLQTLATDVAAIKATLANPAPVGLTDAQLDALATDVADRLRELRFVAE